MRIPLIFLAAAGAFCFSCKAKNKDQSVQDSAASDSSAQVQPFFPVAAFLNSEVQYVDSLPVGIKKYHTSGRKTDSAYIKAQEFRKLAAEFLDPALQDSSFKRRFKESSFFDRNTNTATFFYVSIDPGTEIQRVDVVTQKGDVYDEVKSLYIEKQINANSGIVQKKMFWKPKRNFQIITVSPDTSLKNRSEVVKVVWDNRE